MSLDPILVSVVIPTYNRPLQLEQSLACVIGQSLQALQIIVVNDGGCPVDDVVAKAEDERVLLLNHVHNCGVSAARNTGIENATGQYIAFLDDDDRWQVDHLERLHRVICERPERVVYSDAEQVTEVEVNGAWVEKARELVFSRDFNHAMLYVHNLAPTLCFLVDRDLLTSLRFDTTLATHEDWYFFIQLADQGAFYHLAEVTAEHINRSTVASLSSDTVSMLQSMEEVYRRTHDRVANHAQLLAMRKHAIEAVMAVCSTGSN